MPAIAFCLRQHWVVSLFLCFLEFMTFGEGLRLPTKLHGEIAFRLADLVQDTDVDLSRPILAGRGVG